MRTSWVRMQIVLPPDVLLRYPWIRFVRTQYSYIRTKGLEGYIGQTGFHR
jgi:hypothetical protein